MTKPDFPELAIIGFHRDEESHWVADLDCGHTRHVRHDPPWQNRERVLSLRERIDGLTWKNQEPLPTRINRIILLK